MINVIGVFGFIAGFSWYVEKVFKKNASYLKKKKKYLVFIDSGLPTIVVIARLYGHYYQYLEHYKTVHIDCTALFAGKYILHSVYILPSP